MGADLQTNSCICNQIVLAKFGDECFELREEFKDSWVGRQVLHNVLQGAGGGEGGGRRGARENTPLRLERGVMRMGRSLKLLVREAGALLS